jgi:hypothetical protein
MFRSTPCRFVNFRVTLWGFEFQDDFYTIDTEPYPEDPSPRHC